MEIRNFVKDILLSVAVGDALGAPVKFKGRDEIAANPVTLLYSLESIPADWLNVLARKEDIADLSRRLSKKTYGK